MAFTQEGVAMLSGVLRSDCGQKVILDRDLAILYQVSTGNLNKAVSRNLDRFPEDFMLQLTEEELANLIFHFGTSSWGSTRKLPRAFTKQGVAMLSSVLRSKRAIICGGKYVMRPENQRPGHHGIFQEG